jgi:1,2-diacylglycerol 3-beta-glucosyltransferase
MNGAIPIAVALAQAAGLIMSATFIIYVLIIAVPYARRRPGQAGEARTLGWHLFVPALNEEKVIGHTIDYLRQTLPEAHVWVIDDASEDQTGAIVASRAWRDPMVHVVSRAFPAARTGKGHALNAAYGQLRAWLPAGVRRDQLVVGVIDADGRPAPDCLDVCAGPGLFGDPEVGSVQIEVRMINRDDPRPLRNRGRLVNFAARVLVRMQDLEFRVPIAAIQTTRHYTGTVGLGGNGQFTRMSALDTLADADSGPWRGTLLEDYELSLHLTLSGHRNEFTQDTYVDQEALPDFRRFVRQRTRWGQGTMQCGVYLRQLWTSPYVSVLGALEATYYLLQPWMQIAGTIVYPLPIALFVSHWLAQPFTMESWVGSGGWMIMLLYLIGGAGPFVLWGPLYRRKCERRTGLVASVGLGFAYSLYVFIFYITSWRAFVRILRHRNEWFKTRRNAEFDSGAGQPDGEDLAVLEPLTTATGGTLVSRPAA